MADNAHQLIDKRLEEMERHLTDIYERAEKEIEKTADEYFRKFKKLDDQKRKQVEAGKLSEDEYLAWKKNKILYSKRFTEMKQHCAEQILNVNQTAVAYVNGKLPEIYSLGYNALESAVGGVGGYSFTLVSPDTVKVLATADKSLLPSKAMDAARDIPWNMKNINAEALQGILQGESMDKIARRIRNVQEMNRSSAIRTARTLVTGAENRGRQDSYERAEKDGIILKKEWIATYDMRTRHAHALLDGQLADQDKPFKSELGDIMYPGDPNAHPSNVYNCRCTTAAKVYGFDKSKMSNENYADRQTVADWLDEERKKDPEAFDKEIKIIKNESSDKKLLQKYKDEFGLNSQKSLAKLREMKYNNPEEWKQYKTYLRSLRSGELSPFADFDLYKATSAEIDRYLVGITTSNGIKITGKSNHFIARVIGSEAQRRNGVKIDDVYQALTNQQATVFSIRTDANLERSQKFRFNNVDVTVNPDTGNLIQTNPHALKEKKKQ